MAKRFQNPQACPNVSFYNYRTEACVGHTRPRPRMANGDKSQAPPKCPSIWGHRLTLNVPALC